MAARRQSTSRSAALRDGYPAGEDKLVKVTTEVPVVAARHQVGLDLVVRRLGHESMVAPVVMSRRRANRGDRVLAVCRLQAGRRGQMPDRCIHCRKANS